MNGWYIKRNDQKHGPYTSTQLVEMAKKGQVLPLDWVARGDSEQWMPASQVKGLFATLAAVAPSVTITAPPSLPISTPAVLAALATGSPSHSESNQFQAQELAQTLLYPAIAMLVVSGLALLLACLAVYAMAKNNLNGSPAAVALFFFNTVAAIIATLRMGMLREWYVGLVASILVMIDWVWLFFTGFPAGLSLLGTLAGMSVGAWCLFLLCKPEMRGSFGKIPSLPSLWERIRASMEKQQQEALQVHEDRKRRNLLIGKWESVAKGGMGLRFTEDGAIIRSDGRVDKFTFSKDTIQVVQVGREGANPDKVISLSATELVMTLNGQVCHFKREYSAERDKRWRHLVGKWEPLDGKGIAVQFTKDRAIIREDGLIAKYQLTDASTIEVYADDTPTTIKFKVMSLSEHELAMTAEGQGKHYVRSRTFTEEVERQQTEAANEALRNMGKTAAKVAGGAVLAVGALAFLGLAAAAAANSAAYCPHCGYIRPCPRHG